MPWPDEYSDFNNPDDAAGDKLDDPDVLHDQQHSDVNDAVEALEHGLGLNPEGDYATVRARLDDADTARLMGL